MGGNRSDAAKKARDTLLKNDPDYYRKIRAKRKTYKRHSGDFTSETAREAGKIGGKKSRRPKAKKLAR